jgi:hypothetical protein
MLWSLAHPASHIGVFPGRHHMEGKLNSFIKRALLCSVLALAVLTAPLLSQVAYSKDGDGGGGHGGGGDNSGPGSDNSGRDDDDDEADDDSNDDRDKERRRDQERALEAVKKGKVKPLSEVLRVVQDRAPGDVVRVKLSRSKGQLFYRITVLTVDGRYREVVVNAQSNVVVSMRWR